MIQPYHFPPTVYLTPEFTWHIKTMPKYATHFFCRTQIQLGFDSPGALYIMPKSTYADLCDPCPY